jgi:hypothetical protein
MFYQLMVSHFIFDYGYAVTPSMVAAKSKAKPIGPIALHALLHSIGVAFILYYNSIPLHLIVGLSTFQFVSHLIIDVMKGRIENDYPSLKSPTNPWHWHLFQMDQFMHLSVMYVICDIANKF